MDATTLLKQQLGELIFQITLLQARNQELEKENQSLKEQKKD